ncbi:MAG: hypothetical protein Q4B18_01715 [Bacillota bacterium]|nr:hypothetical protein [Bacillota bacterium]
MAFNRKGFSGFRDKKKLFSGIMLVLLGLFFFAMILTHGYSLSKVVFGVLLTYLGIKNLLLAK